jgi:hypothetical protein
MAREKKERRKKERTKEEKLSEARSESGERTIFEIVHRSTDKRFATVIVI